MAELTVTDLANDLREVKALLLTGAVPPGYLSIEQAAAYLNTSVGTLRAWVRLKGVPYHKPGKELQFRVRELDRWMDRYQKGLTGLALTSFNASRRRA